MSECVVKVERVDPERDADLALPAYATAGAAGMDVRAALAPDEARVLAPGARMLVPTGLRLAIPIGFEGQVRPRSGLALKHGITVLNAPGTIDSDYRGEVQVLLVNLGAQPFEVRRGERVAQLVFAAVTSASLVLGELSVDDETVRDSGGFGHTGRG